LQPTAPFPSQGIDTRIVPLPSWMGQFRTGLTRVTEGMGRDVTREELDFQLSASYGRYPAAWRWKGGYVTRLAETDPNVSASQPLNLRRRSDEYHHQPADNEMFASKLQLSCGTRPAVLQHPMRRVCTVGQPHPSSWPRRLRLSSSRL